MDPLNVIVMGGGLLWLFVTAVREDWHHARLNRIRTSGAFRLVLGGMIIFATAWMSRGAYRSPFIGPEASENKYVRVSRIPSPKTEFEYAVLIEFGTVKVNSEGFVVSVKPAQEEFDHWYGLPGRMDRQTEFGIYWHEMDTESKTLWIRMPDFTISPRRSYYLCVLSHTEQGIEPNDISYFAVAANEKALLPSQRTKIGHQYQRRR